MTSTTAKRFTLKEYHRLTELGFFGEDDRVELVRGEIMEMAAKGTPHSVCCSNLLRELARLVADKAELRCQDPITIPPNSEPEPDFVIARQRDDNYLSSHPHPEDVLLVIEIAESSFSYDKEIKLPLYAEAGISDYWRFNLVENHLETYSEPYQELQGKFGYSLKRVVLPNQSIFLPYFPDFSLDLSNIFPKTIP
ncbi:MAG: hypothetical protein BRC59_10105 [Cyanobacteria bacterium SW_4_48_29]|jgi:Uma2 family endonuclease|nr:MAG: hypothetical protein BRC34_13875 [Cyanobacteria bacterium QH_1_48_107]PSP29067.1 MAG: hypothetical protein BRC59_10105 [Cyanobacteria bacterium SW_4_48_29]